MVRGGAEHSGPQRSLLKIVTSMKCSNILFYLNSLKINFVDQNKTMIVLIKDKLNDYRLLIVFARTNQVMASKNSTPLLYYSILIIVLTIFSIQLSSSNVFAQNADESLSGKLDQMLVDNNFELEMIEFMDQQHVSQKTSLKSKTSADVLTRLSDLLASIAQLKFAIKSKFVDIFKNENLIENYGSTGEEEDMIKLKLTLTRAFLRCKLTIMMYSGSTWKRCYKLIEHYKSESPKMRELLLNIIESSLIKDPFNLDRELEAQNKVLGLYRRKVLQDGDHLDSDEKILAKFDEMIDNLFKLDFSSARLDLSWLDGKDWRVNPLAQNENQIKTWIAAYVDEKYLQMIKQREKPIEGQVFVKPEEWSTFKASEIDRWRRDMLDETFSNDLDGGIEYFS